MKKLILCKTILYLLLISCNEQTNHKPKNESNKIVCNGCDGCELMYIGMPKNISSIDTSSGWKEKGQKLIITGTTFQLDGKTPAPNVVIYYWQTDNNGYYSPKAEMDEKAKKHGHIRGWVKTDANGKYTIKTIRPAPYPNDILPAHIHLSIKEPDIENEYHTDEINFDDDKLLIPHLKKYRQENRGGSGITRILLKDSLQIAEHDIILGLNIPNYPKKRTLGKQSGLNIGEDQPSFLPFHAFGPDKATQVCPVCKYGRYHGIIYYVGNNPNWKEIKLWLTFLETETVKRKNHLKVYFVYGNENSYDKQKRQKQLEKLGIELNIKNTALTFVPSFSDQKTEANLNKINPSAENTFIIYKHRSIVGKYVDIKPTTQNFNSLSKTLDRTKGDYFDLPEPKHE
ncbi:dioxygenase family protein [Flavobacterium solisilvae]|uniref:Intradiol ring-cleavage dioxygenase n=1 Tax=Flavobacterium solisilvae TaxID=1852019 RepID=A0ABX1QVH4_9FLAO|nr:intradiol ring-cleavage dioxygenase [Flavobacterium solisilvae]NMH25035.1 intradiol ring-cleavage dioxygenase [Flavobacterium solisilvae]